MTESTQEDQPRQQQSPPGRDDAMLPRPDHGEHSYRGCGRLVGKRAIVTGADSGIGKAVAIAFPARALTSSFPTWTNTTTQPTRRTG